MNDLTIETDGAVRTITLNRPTVRNALSNTLLSALAHAMAGAETDSGVRCAVLTGADPAFCAGLDLREVGSTGLPRDTVHGAQTSPWQVLGAMRTPVIAAVNGACVTGGLELALQCSFLVASERAVFADTHARVGLHPAGGLSALLPQFVGLNFAREMSFTSRFVDAAEAFRVGLVNRVVPHEDLLPTVAALAAEIAEADPAALLAINDTYRDVSLITLGDGLALERRRGAEWRFDPAAVEARRHSVIARGRQQTS